MRLGKEILMAVNPEFGIQNLFQTLKKIDDTSHTLHSKVFFFSTYNVPNF